MIWKCNNVGTLKRNGDIHTPLLVWINFVADAIIIFWISRLCSWTKFLHISLSLPHNPSINLQIFFNLISNLTNIYIYIYIRTRMSKMCSITYMLSSVPFVLFYLRCMVHTSRKTFLICRCQYIRLTILSSHTHFLWKNHPLRHRSI